VLVTYQNITISLSLINSIKQVYNMGALDHISDLFDCSYRSSRYKKRKQFQVTQN